MALPTNQYISVVPEASTTSHLLLNLNGEYLVFYTTAATGELRVRTIGVEQAIVIDQHVVHCHGVVVDGVALVYAVREDGTVHLLRYKRFGDTSYTLTQVGIGNSAVYVHVAHQQNRFYLASDDGAKLFLVVANDPEFLLGRQGLKLYSNPLDPEYYVCRPAIGFHPEDIKPTPLRDRLTIAVERLTRATGVKEVGFFVVEFDS